MNYKDYAATTWVQFLLKCEAREQQELREWHRVRRICYQQYLSTPLKDGYRHDDICDFMPLPGDPSPKQRQKAAERMHRGEIKKQQREGEKLIKQYKKLGYL